MCATCGCSGEDRTVHHHAEETHGQGERVSLEADVLEKNDRFAAQTRLWLKQRKIAAYNVMSSPGAGKTTLLERTLLDRGTERAFAVIEGDQETDRDAQRIRAAGARAVQIHTGAGCHLDAHQVAHAIEYLKPEPSSILFIENVGNLVCPALFDLGERARIVVASVTEGDDKPLKYPHMFRAADVVVLNKIDLLEYVSFDVERFNEHARRANPRVRLFAASATRGVGLRPFYTWLEA
jgi:hydrogenase nickel incorporation protein HypB